MNYFILGAGLALLGVAHAGHEFPFYPSFYPQEITVEALDARSAAQRLAKGTLHAYAGGEITAQPNPAKTGSVASLGGRSEEHTSELQSQSNLVCRLLLE